MPFSVSSLMLPIVQKEYPMPRDPRLNDTVGAIFRDTGGTWTRHPLFETPMYIARYRPRWWSWRFWRYMWRGMRQATKRPAAPQEDA